MSRARDEYESILEDFDSKDSDVIIKADNYIQELYKDCKYWESSSDYYKEKYENLEQQKAELIEFAKEMREIGKLNPDRLPEYTDIIYHHANDLITRITGGK